MTPQLKKTKNCKLSALVAMTEARVIGRDGKLPWHLPEDLQFFKHTTLNHPILMGRGTFDSIGKALPKRQNIILTRDQSFQAPGCDIIHDPNDLATLALIDPTIYIIGGGQIYQLFLPILDELIITHVQQDHNGDTYFPPFADQFFRVETLLTTPDFTTIRYLSRPDVVTPKE